ncbi:DUF3182 family protein [Pseudoxanthomonas daejeonensis]|uniref:DUF3182 family protein n=1 Tax=Pseudoxanthomonas daejeonensis TaxID=266062 RepID=UPI001EE46D81|nr:DUF3182 family protein [Pseudoxanthomonas daejeonensis]
MASKSPAAAPRTVFTLRADAQPRCTHERASQAWVAQRLATLFGWEFGGEYESGHAASARPYFVPDETLDAAQAAALGIIDEDDLFGGVVPHAFVASKVITHPLPTATSPAPPGWQPRLSAGLAGAVLSGFSVFDADLIEAAGQLLLASGGTVRLKEAQARGGNGQHLFTDAATLRDVVATLDRDTVRRHGVVLEQNLEHATTCSVGEIRVAGRRLAYLGTQRQIDDGNGNEVYGGSHLRVLQGGLDALEAIAADPAERAALRQAMRYDAAVSAAYPGFFASRRNYDVVAGHDAQGRWRCGVLEQSWRMGGASPAEILALAAFLQPGAPAVLDVSCHESHDPGQPVPQGAQVSYHDPAAASGPALKYARVEGGDGSPA